MRPRATKTSVTTGDRNYDQIIRAARCLADIDALGYPRRSRFRVEGHGSL
jgi:hypothetical protein